MKNFDSRTAFERICLTLQANFHNRAMLCRIPPSTPAFTRPIGTVYFSLLNQMLKAPMKGSSMNRFNRQAFCWSGLCKSTKDGYVLTELGKSYVNNANLIHDYLGKCVA